MDGECFLNSCFYAKIHFRTIESTKHTAATKYADPKLNAECRVQIRRLPANCEKLYNSRKSKKRRRLTIESDSEEEEETKITSKPKRQRKKVPIEGTRRLLRLSDSEDEAEIKTEEENTEIGHIDLNAPKKSSEFVTEKSLNTPEGLHVVQRTTSSMVNEKIKSLVEFEEKKFEVVNLCSDDEEEAEPNANTEDCDAPSMPTLSNFVKPAKTDEAKILSEATEEKLRNFANRMKPKENSTKLTTPKPLNSGRMKANRNESKSFKKKYSNSMRKKLQEDPNWTSYCTSVKEANQKNGSHTTSTSFQHVPTIGNKCPEPIATYIPPVPQPVPVKAKSTPTSRNDRLTSEFIKSKDVPIKERKEPKTKRFSNPVSPHKVAKSKISAAAAAATTESFKRKREQTEATNVLTNSENVPKEISLSFKPSAKRVARGTEGQSTKRPTASARANLALHSDIPNRGRLRDGSYGKKMSPCFPFPESRP